MKKTMELIKINKVAAKGFYLQGKTIYLLPCKCSPDGLWVKPYAINKDNDGDFETLINSYTYYNCSNYELGRRCSYYIE